MKIGGAEGTSFSWFVIKRFTRRTNANTPIVIPSLEILFARNVNYPFSCPVSSRTPPSITFALPPHPSCIFTRALPQPLRLPPLPTLLPGLGLRPSRLGPLQRRQHLRRIPRRHRLLHNPRRRPLPLRLGRLPPLRIRLPYHPHLPRQQHLKRRRHKPPRRVKPHIKPPPHLHCLFHLPRRRITNLHRQPILGHLSLDRRARDAHARAPVGGGSDVDGAALDEEDPRGESGVERGVEGDGRGGREFRRFEAELVVPGEAGGGGEEGEVAEGEADVGEGVGLAEGEGVEVVGDGVVGCVF